MSPTSTPVTESLHDAAAKAAAGPGVYLLKDKSGRILYVGKAANLRKRLASYFTATTRNDVKTRILIEHVASFEVLLTASEKAALILEANLIKRHKPRYNVVLKDDKRYPLLRLDRVHPYPRLQIVRKIKPDRARYFGPFASAGGVRRTLNIINKTFRLRKCSDSEFMRRQRPCLHYQMKSCLGPCCLPVAPAVYRELVHDVVLFLNGRTPDLIRQLKQKMLLAAKKQHFEEAALLRDKLFAVERTLEKQVVVTTDLKDRDVAAAAVSSELSLITLLLVRGGFLQGTRHFFFEKAVSSESDMLQAFLMQYYEKAPFVPPEILVSNRLAHTAVIEDAIAAAANSRVAIRRPQRGPKKKLLDMAKENADHQLRERTEAMASDRALLEALQKQAALRRLPRRIECVDNAHLSGDTPVSALVVFKMGRAYKPDYRTYYLQHSKARDDYAAMEEVLSRRFASEKEKKPLPDLLLIDGGKGQLNIAVAVARRLNLDEAFDILAIAKKAEHKGESSDKVYRHGRVNAIHFGQDREVLLLLQRIRDEAHRFVVQFHRRRRAKSIIHSELDRIPGIGAKRRERLLAAFGSIDRIHQASIEELRRVPGMTPKAARAVKTHIRPR